MCVWVCASKHVNKIMHTTAHVAGFFKKFIFTCFFEGQLMCSGGNNILALLLFFVFFIHSFYSLSHLSLPVVLVR